MFQMHAELRSVTAICVIEDVTKCPLGYTPIVRTFDTDTDADLWKDGFFGRRVTRYVCISKSQGRPEHVIQDVQVLAEKELPPEGYSIIQQTTDTSQKAFKKKVLCYKHIHYKQNMESVVDVVILNKMKNPPDGYDPIGEINGMHFLVKKVSALTRLSNPLAAPGLSYNLPGATPVYPSLHDSMNNLSVSPANGMAPAHGHRNSLPSTSFSSMPGSPAYNGYSNGNTPNKVNYNYNTATLSTHLTGMEGVPFVLRDDLRPTADLNGPYQGSRLPKLNFPIKSETDIERDYSYDFRAERDALYQEVM